MKEKNKKIFIAGHKGLIGSSVLKVLKKNYKKIVTIDRNKLDLRDEKSVFKFFKKNKFDYVVICAAVVGGIQKNATRPVDLLYDNLKIQNNLIMSSYKNKTKKLIFLGSSCIYPKYSKTPIKENQLLEGKLEKTNESYAIAKITGIKLCEALFKEKNFKSISLMPTNVYGINDNFDPINGHVIPSIFYKINKANKSRQRKLELLGDGKPLREFIYSDDVAEAIYKLLTTSEKRIRKICRNEYPIFNVGSGEIITINNLVKKICKIFDYNGKISFRGKKWNGTFKKNLNSHRIKSLGWRSKIKLEQGLKLIKETKFT